MFNIEKMKFNKYCKLFSIWFNEQKPTYKNINYKDLICKIYNKYKNMNRKQRVLEEVLLKDKINEDNFIDGDVSAFISIILTSFTSFTMKFSKEDSMHIFISLCKTLLFLIVYFFSVQLIFACRKVIRMGFYNLCLNTLNTLNKYNELESYNKINEVPLLEIAAEKDEDNFDKKVYKNLEQIKSFLGVK